MIGAQQQAPSGEEKTDKLPKYFMFGILAGIAFILVFGSVIIFSPHRGGSYTSTGFAKIKPQLYATGLTHDGAFTVVLTNGVGTNIRMTSGKVVDLNNPGYSCMIASELFVPKMIGPGENTKISYAAPTGCVKAGNPGDVYNAKIILNYEVNISDMQTMHTETGTLRGPME